MDEKNDMREQIYIALDILKKKLGLSTRAAVMEYLITQHDPTIMQVAARRIKLTSKKDDAHEQ
jgi:hypothetical protein